jgi:UDP-glucuronate decarboxylase
MASPAEVTGPINLGNPGEFTMLDLAQAVIELTGSRSQLIHMPLPQDDPRQRQPDITRAREQLGWDVSVPLRDGLVKTIDYFRALLA